MKKVFFSWLCVALSASSMFSGCSEEEKPHQTEPVFPELQEITLAAGDSKDLSFSANMDWTLTIDKSWCRFDDNGVKTAQLSGKAAENQTVKIVVSDEGLDFATATASIDMTMGSGAPKTIFRISRSGMTPEIKMWIKDEQTGKWVESDKIEFVYNPTSQEVTPVEVGFSANYNWTVTSLPEGLELSESPFGGTANALPGSEGFRSAYAKIPDSRMVYPLSGEILTSDSDNGNVKKYQVSYPGFAEGDLTVKGEGATYHSISFSDDGHILVMGDMVSEETRRDMSVYAKDMKYSVFTVTKGTHPLTGMPQYQLAGDDFWVKVSDDKNGSVSISVTANDAEAREAYVCIFPGQVSVESTDLQFYIEREDYADNRWTISQKGKAAVVVSGGIKLYWEKQYESMLELPVQLAKNVPEFNIYIMSYGYPDDKTFAYTFTEQEIKDGGRLLIVPDGFAWNYQNPVPKSLKGDSFPVNGNGKYPIQGDWNFGSGGFLYDITETTSGSIAALTINDNNSQIGAVLILKKE